MIARPLSPSPASAAAGPAGRWAFGFGPMFFGLLAAGIIFVIPAWSDSRILFLLLAWNAAVAALWIFDFRRLSAIDLGVTRMWRTPLALGVPAQIELQVASNARVPVKVIFIDDIPAALKGTLPVGVVSVPAGDTGFAAYAIRPAQRGDWRVGGVSLRCRTPWGIGERWLRAGVDQTVRVYPDLFESRRQAMFLIRSRQMALEKRRARSSVLGRDFESLREYQPGDDVRDVCWTATARRAKLVTKIYQPERSQAVWILVDGGRLLRARLADRMKLDALVDTALALAEVAMMAGDRVGLIAYGQRVHHRILPGRGHPHLRVILDALATLPADSAEGDHAGAAAALRASQKQRALIVWLTDLAETAAVPDVIEQATQLSPHHVVVFALLRQAELNSLAAESPANEGAMFRVLAAQETVERREALLGRLIQRGAYVLDLPPDAPAAAVIDQYLKVKERNLV